MQTLDTIRARDTVRARELLLLDLAEWRRKAQTGSELQFHNAQIDAVALVLERWMDAKQPSVSYEEVEAAWITWEWFRGRFLQRRVADQAAALGLLDTLAERLYRPFRDAAGSTLRTFPLVAFQPTVSPVAMERGLLFRPAGEVDDNTLARVVRNLPVPLVNLPWSHATHLSLLPTIAHEVGHLVHDEFGIAATVAGALAAFDRGGGKPSWTSWSEEVFCDVFGAVALGPAYSLALAQALGPNDTAATRAYPTKRARMALQRAVMATLGAEDLVPPALVPAGAAEAHELDVESVRDALLAAKLTGGRTLVELLGGGWTATDAQKTRDLVAAMRAGQKTFAKGTDPRHLVAAPTLWWWGDANGWDTKRSGELARAFADTQVYSFRSLSLAGQKLDFSRFVDRLRTTFAAPL